MADSSEGRRVKHSVRISQDAEADIERNANWWADHHSLEEAIEWLSVVRRQLIAIGDSPLSYGISAENGALPFEVRDALLGKGQRGSYGASSLYREIRW